MTQKESAPPTAVVEGSPALKWMPLSVWDKKRKYKLQTCYPHVLLPEDIKNFVTNLQSLMLVRVDTNHLIHYIHQRISFSLPLI